MQHMISTRKLERPYDGPYKITEVFTNGTVAVQKGIVNERVNIRATHLPVQTEVQLGKRVQYTQRT